MNTPDESPDRSFTRRLWWWLGFLLVCRLILLIWAPHTDPTEARYAEMARKMVETGDWVTPEYDYGIPFWASPPLAMWVSAIGIDLFGATEFGSRILTFLAALGVLALVSRMGNSGTRRPTGLVATALLMSMPLFFYCSGAVMTDLMFVAGTTLAMAGFRTAVTENSRGWGYGFFIGLAIGLVARGPLALAVVLPPLLGWRILYPRGKRIGEAMPWLTGTLLLLVIVIPWYAMAEHRTPGFLHYFFIGEHWNRLTRRNWSGDLYGNAHSVLPGTILVYFLAGTLPACVGFFVLPVRRWRELAKWSRADEGAGLYWLLWTLWPLALFIPFRNILASSPLPALPGAALLLAALAAATGRQSPGRPHVLFSTIIASSSIAVASLLGVSFLRPEWLPKSSQKSLIHRYLHDRLPGNNLLYFGVRKSSAEFYAAGNIDHTGSVAEVEEKLNAEGILYLAVPARYLPMLPGNLQRRIVRVDSWGTETLYRELPPVPDATRAP